MDKSVTKEINRLKRELKGREREAAQYARVVHALIRDVTELQTLPPEPLRLRIGTTTTEANFLAQGLQSSKKVIEQFGTEPDGPILDWGCGSGRTLNWLLRKGTWRKNYRGCDVDALAIDWLKGQGYGNVSLCSDEPALPYPDGFFAGIFSFSVLTHIPPQRHREWYREISRILRPGGKAYLTVKGEAGATSQQFSSEDAKTFYRINGYAYEEHTGHYKDAAFVSPDFTRSATSDFLRIENYQVGGYGTMDEFVACRL